MVLILIAAGGKTRGKCLCLPFARITSNNSSLLWNHLHRFTFYILIFRRWSFFKFACLNIVSFFQCNSTTRFLRVFYCLLYSYTSFITHFSLFTYKAFYKLTFYVLACNNAVSPGAAPDFGGNLSWMLMDFASIRTNFVPWNL